MELVFAPLFSGSSGNAVYVGCGDTHLLIDAGVSGTRVLNALKSIGVDPASLTAMLVTHEHSDHIKGIGILARKLDIPIYATEGTWQGMEGKIGTVSVKNQCFVRADENFFLGDIEICPFATPHDANESCGYLFEAHGPRFALATDLGSIRDSWMKYVCLADAVLLESNYDPNMLDAGPYPYDLKRRIRSRNGHLSNDDCGEAASKLIEKGVKHIVLGHLSKENNFPELAMQTTKGVLFSHGIDSERDVRLNVALRDEITGVFGVRSELSWKGGV